LILTVGLGSLIAVTGCADSTSITDPDVAAAKSSAVSAFASIDARVSEYPTQDQGLYLAMVRRGLTDEASIQDQVLLEAGAMICEKLDHGIPADTLAGQMITFSKQSGMSEADTVAIVSAAVVNLCPSHVADISGS